MSYAKFQNFEMFVKIQQNIFQILENIRLISLLRSEALLSLAFTHHFAFYTLYKHLSGILKNKNTVSGFFDRKIPDGWIISDRDSIIIPIFI